MLSSNNHKRNEKENCKCGDEKVVESNGEFYPEIFCGKPPLISSLAMNWLIFSFFAPLCLVTFLCDVLFFQIHYWLDEIDMADFASHKDSNHLVQLVLTDQQVGIAVLVSSSLVFRLVKNF